MMDGSQPLFQNLTFTIVPTTLLQDRIDKVLYASISSCMAANVRHSWPKT